MHFGRNCHVSAGTVLLLLGVCNTIIVKRKMVLKVVITVFNQPFVVSSPGSETLDDQKVREIHLCTVNWSISLWQGAGNHCPDLAAGACHMPLLSALRLKLLASSSLPSRLPGPTPCHVPEVKRQNYTWADLQEGSGCFWEPGAEDLTGLICMFKRAAAGRRMPCFRQTCRQTLLSIS